MSHEVSDKLESDDIQGLLARGFGGLPFASYVIAQITDPASARSLVSQWASRITSASASPQDTAMNVALTAQGVCALTGKSAFDLGFSEPYATGMVTDYRSRLLGDVGENSPAGWEWGGPNGAPVHLAVLLYAKSEAALSELQDSVIGVLTTTGMAVTTLLGTAELSDREPFGFHDGISQPVIAEYASAGRDGDVVKSGEFVLGYVNEYAQRTERPLLAADADPHRILPRDPEGSGAADLGRNGSYLVFRQLHQNTAAFEDYLTRSASVDGHVDEVAKERLAAKLVGRWRNSGAPLTLSPDVDDKSYAKANGFAYHEQDADGLRCPLGAHVRRANPRDSLPPKPGTEESRQVNRRHRLLRRGRSYGPAATGSSKAPRGLHFLCLNAHIARQYEFVQHSWVNDPNFDGMVGVEDPLTGPRVGVSSFVEPSVPVRRRHTGLPQFVQVRGGAYFFLPGIRALRFLSTTPAI
jgi:Dyp-type peroxidase family